ncbi:hypothetical protein GOE04_11725 [Sinorhizobium medicae]|uniref:hypothetical protein n=1 Tax=Sinorhizobium medicae TaxID=110321 RepID=UPI001AAD96C6|nr:hypothetical protein [Sinorhizobium medicae]MBO1943197.1 hypothetical protein [Sinorhizobium medicae]MDX0921837.1 hypothetical protein [Sinorhizobium medicae]MDX0926699.1 hypothetical protein [Sinorhizobium medicae]MDX0934140.1 hypothetical protein [Sinorhizobium medicae]MDX0940280.1 hypothetical protein [Sinorhizobium medicae]
MKELKRTLTREELHGLVWSTPILKLAEEFGLSDRGFAKICARHLVPTPPRGYWAKVEAGQSVKKTPLRSVENKALHTVHIGASKAHLSDSVQAALAAARAERKRQAEERKQQLSIAKASAATLEPLVINQPIHDCHKSVASIVKQLHKAKPDGEGVVSAKGVCVHERTRERAVGILHHLAVATEAGGAELKANENGLHLSTSEGSVRITLTEERKRPKHIPTESELAEYQRRKTKRDKDQARGLWSFERLEPWPEFDIVYTGKLTIGYDGYANGLRKSWSDGRSQAVEGCLEAFVAAMRTIIVAEAEERRVTQEKERARQAMRRRRELARLRAEREDKRSAYLDEIAAARRKVADLQTTIETIPQADNLPADYARMIGWAKERLAELEARTTVEAIQATLQEENLFPEPDELLDPQGDPPPKRNYWDD